MEQLQDNLVRFFRAMHPFVRQISITRNWQLETTLVKLRSNSPSTPAEPIQCGQFTTLWRFVYLQKTMLTHILGWILQSRLSRWNQKASVVRAKPQKPVWHIQEDYKVFVAIQLLYHFDRSFTSRITRGIWNSSRITGIGEHYRNKLT